MQKAHCRVSQIYSKSQGVDKESKEISMLISWGMTSWYRQNCLWPDMIKILISFKEQESAVFDSLHGQWHSQPKGP